MVRWMAGFNRIYWGHEGGRLVVSPVFDDIEPARGISDEIDLWNDRLVKMTIIEYDTEYTICCYQDPAVDSGGMGVFRPGLPRIAGYDQARPLFVSKSPLFQVWHAGDYARLETYRAVSRLIYPARCRIISPKHLKRQEYYYERQAAS